QIGNGNGPQVDIAVDPIDGTTLTSKGLPGAISVVALTERGAMFGIREVVYMNKIAVGPDAVGSIDIQASPSQNLRWIAKAKRCLNGDMQCTLWPRDEQERQRAVDAGYDMSRVYTTEDLIGSGDVFFAATGVTDGELLKGVRFFGGGATTHSLVMRSYSGTVR